MRYIGKERTALQAKVVILRDSGKLYKEIAAELGISPTLASTLYREATEPNPTILDRIKLWFSFRL